jgi:hypothetical protein
MVALTLTGCGLLFGCGGGSGGTGGTVTPPAGLTDQQRATAATQTAQNNSSCTAIQPFYWEVGDQRTPLASGTAGGTAPNSTTPMLIASASKWFFGAYMLELRSGQLTANDIAALTMQTGYTNLSYDACLKLSRAAQDLETVDQCFQAANLSGNNSDQTTANIGKFFYNGGHFQKYADIDLNLGGMNNATLKAAVAAQIGQDFSFTYDSPQLAAGVATTPSDYGFFLRKILSNQLRMHNFLGASAVCTNPNTCANAVSTPIPSTESWHYSLAHWVEDDPTVGDGAFSSPGAFGFYPWIDSTKTYYGMLSRYSLIPAASAQSVLCGRKIRKAWLTGTQQ